MKGLLGLLKKDFKVAYRNFFFLIVFIVGIILISVTNYLVPEKISTDSKFIYIIENNTQELQPLIAFLEKQERSIKVSSKDALINIMKEERNTVGIILKSINNKPSFEIVMQGYENNQSKKSIALSFKSILNANNLDTSNIETIVLNTTRDYKSIPFNKSMIPLLILNEPVMLGFIFLATLIFMEKEEGTTNAYMTTPEGIGKYLISKIIIMILLAVLSTILLTIFTIGFSVNWFYLLFIVTIGSIFGSTTAIVLTSFFDTISKAMIWILVVSLVFTIPMISYFVPSFAPAYITSMPTYSLMFAIKEAIFPMGNTSIIYDTAIYLTVISVILYGASLLLYKRSMVLD